MGSFQQISLGVICLVAAFIFGNYVNNNPSLNAPDGADVAPRGLASNQAGNVQSRLTTDPFAGIEKQPAPIMSMNRPLKSRFSVPTGKPDSTSMINQPAVESRLPPPNQLANQGRTAPNSSNPSLFKKPNENSGLNQPNVQVPDFSAIAAEIRNTPIELSRMGMPMHSNSGSVPEPRTASSPLKDLVHGFQNPEDQVISQAKPNPPWNQKPSSVNRQPTRQAQPNEPVRISSAESIAPWNQQIRQPERFTSDDFESKLNDNIFGLKQPRPANIAPTETATHDDWRKNTQPNWGAQKASNPNLTPLQSPVGNESQAFQNHVAAKPILDHTNQPINPEVSRIAPTAKQGQSPAGFQAPSSVPNQVRTRIPFGLTDTARTELVALRTNASSKIDLDTTKFVDHVVGPGESLQSISTRYYGKPDYYLDIYIANRSRLRNPGDIQSGLTIRVPIYETP